MSTSTTDQRRPWGLSRMAPCLTPATAWPTSMTVDPETQLGIYVGLGGDPAPIMASSIHKHGSLDQSQTSKTTNGTQDGKEDTDTTPDQHTD